MDLIRTKNGDSNMLTFAYYVRPECEAKKFKGFYFIFVIKLASNYLFLNLFLDLKRGFQVSILLLELEQDSIF
jgi:hypothetical protein